MLKGKVVFCEPNMIGEKHLLFNQSLISLLLKSKEFSRVQILGENIHVNRLSSKIEIKKEITFLRLRNNYFFRFNCFLKSLNFWFREDSILYLSLSPFQLVTVFFLTLFAKREVHVIMHGELGILSKKRVGKFGLLFRFVLRFILRFRSSNFVIILIGEVVKRNLLLYAKNINPKGLIVIEHPLTQFTETDYKGIKSKYGTIGTSLLIKNSHYIAKLYGLLNKSNKQMLTHVGSVNPALLPYFSEINLPFDGSQFVSEEAYLKEISRLYFIISFIQDEDYYDLCPSGTIVEAIRFGIPILSLSNKNIEKYFSDFGAFGEIFLNIEEMALFINENISQIINGNLNKKYAEAINNARLFLASGNAINELLY
jgi:hypothetical protein